MSLTVTQMDPKMGTKASLYDDPATTPNQGLKYPLQCPRPHLGPMSSPTKLISGYSSCGIITLSLTRVAGGLGGTKGGCQHLTPPETPIIPPPDPL